MRIKISPPLKNLMLRFYHLLLDDASVKKFSGRIKGIKKILLQGNQIGSNGVIEVLKNEDIESINLSSNPFGMRGLNALFSSTRLKEITINKTVIPIESFRLLIGNGNIEQLFLEDYELSDEEAKILRQTSIQFLAFAYQRITETGIRSLVSNPNLNSLNMFRRTRAQPPPIPFHPRSLREGTQLKNLYLKNIPLRNEDLVVIGELRSLEILSLVGIVITGAGLRNLKNLPNLKLLDLADNREIGDEGVREIPPMVRDLGLSNCGVTSVGIGYLATTMYNLERLNISTNQIGNNGFLILAGIPSLKKVVFSFDAGAIDGITALAGKRNLSYLQIISGRAPIDDEGLADAIAKNPTLEKIVVSIRQLRGKSDLLTLNTVVTRIGGRLDRQPDEISDIINRNFATRSLGETCF